MTKDHGATVSDGSPLVALHAGPPAFTRLFWVEQKETYADSLRAHQAAHPNNNISVYQGDANARVDDVLTELPRVYPVFAFLDPRGPELSWQTVRKLASHKAPGFPRVELLILFAYNMALARLMPHRPELMVNEHELDRFMPDRERWREIYAKRSLFTAPEYRRVMLGEYVRGIKELGYASVPPPYLVRARDNRPLYFLIFATDNGTGEKIMSWCLEHLPDIRLQLGLFANEESY